MGREKATRRSKKMIKTLLLKKLNYIKYTIFLVTDSRFNTGNDKK